jgi:hypothetical protein
MYYCFYIQLNLFKRDVKFTVRQFRLERHPLNHRDFYGAWVKKAKESVPLKNQIPA